MAPGVVVGPAESLVAGVGTVLPVRALDAAPVAGQGDHDGGCVTSRAEVAFEEDVRDVVPWLPQALHTARARATSRNRASFSTPLMVVNGWLDWVVSADSPNRDRLTHE